MCIRVGTIIGVMILLSALSMMPAARSTLANPLYDSDIQQTAGIDEIFKLVGTAEPTPTNTPAIATLTSIATTPASTITETPKVTSTITNTPTPTITNTPYTSTPTGSSTSTPSQTPTRTRTGIPPPSCPNHYGVTTRTATMIPGVTDIGNHIDDGTTVLTLPFQFSFYGNSHNTVNVSSNGNLQFSSANNEYTNQCLINNNNNMNSLIAPHWDDLRTDAQVNCSVYPSGCGIFTTIQGHTPNRIFIIEWRAVYYVPESSGAAINFETILHEDGIIDYVYGNVPDNGAGATIGVQRGTGYWFTQYSCNWAYVLNGLKITLRQPPPCGPLPIIEGNVTWQGVASANRQSVTGTLTLCVQGSAWPFSFSTDSNGYFFLRYSFYDGSYNWSIKGGRHVSSSSPADGSAIVLVEGSAMKDFGTIRGGNATANNDNIVNSSDFTSLRTRFGLSGVWSSDFDYNQVVNSRDFSIIRSNFGQTGHSLMCP